MFESIAVKRLKEIARLFSAHGLVKEAGLAEDAKEAYQDFESVLPLNGTQIESWMKEFDLAIETLNKNGFSPQSVSGIATYLKIITAYFENAVPYVHHSKDVQGYINWLIKKYKSEGLDTSRLKKLQVVVYEVAHRKLLEVNSEDVDEIRKTKDFLKAMVEAINSPNSKETLAGRNRQIDLRIAYFEEQARKPEQKLAA